MKISLTRISDRLNEEGLHAYVEQTGGGCATLFAGPTKKVDDTGEILHAAAVGTGWFERGPFGIEAFADTSDLCVGPDGEEGPFTYLKDTDTEEDVFLMAGLLALEASDG